MKKVSIAVNRLFDEKVKDQIIGSLGTRSIEEQVIYFYSNCEDIGYTILFLKGKELSSSEFIRILTYSLSIKGLYLITEDTNIKFDFYDKGKSVYKLEVTHPDTFSPEGNFNVMSEGDVQILSEFGVNVNLEKVQKIIRGEDQFIFFSRTFGKSFLTELGLNSLTPMLFWDWDNLIRINRIPEFKDRLLEHKEFENIHAETILPYY